MLSGSVLCGRFLLGMAVLRVVRVDNVFFVFTPKYDDDDT